MTTEAGPVLSATTTTDESNSVTVAVKRHGMVSMKVLKLGRAGLSENPRSLETAGIEHFRQAMCSKKPESFRGRILKSKSMFARAARLYHSPRSRAHKFRCLAWMLYLDFYLARNAVAKKRTLEKSWKLAKQALRAFDDSGNHLEFGTTYDQLATVAGLAFDFHFSPRLRGQRLKEGVEYGRQASKAVLPDENRQLLARVCAKTALFIDAIGNEGSEIELNEERDKEGLELWKQAEQLDKEEALFQVGLPPGGFFHVVDEDESHRIHNEALQVARRRRDSLAVGWLLSQQAGWTFFDGVRALSLEDSIRSMERSLETAENAARMYAPSGFTSPNCGVVWCEAPYPEHFLALSWFQRDEKSRGLQLEKAMGETPFLLRQAKRSGYPQALAYADHVTSKILMDLGLREAGSRRKMKLLRRALRHRLRACRITARVQPNDLHRNGTYISRLGEIRAGIADLLENRKARIKMLTRAAQDKGRSVRFAIDYTNAVSKGRPHLLRRMLGVDLIVYGDLLMRLYKVSGNDEIQERAAKAYSDATGFLKDSTAYRRLGEAYWKAGEIHDRLRANLAAAEDFALASKAYLTLAEKSPDAGPVFLDYAKYLEAWSNIEQARASHGRSDYEESRKFFAKAADIHKLAERWSFLAPYYTALAKLESAENLSRIGRCEESVSTFKDAALMFRETTLSLQKRASMLDQREEKTMVEGIVLAFKEEYSLARVMIEEARIAEDQGDYPTSSGKFREASRLLEESAKKAATKREKKELLYIATLSKAWEQMARTSLAEPEECFRKATELFEESMDYSSDENAKTLSIGHKHFCEALAASNAFTHTLNQADYETAAKALTVASNHFADTGFYAQSRHAQGCKLLLDAHAYIAQASKSPDGAQQASDYGKITAILREAAEHFREAHQTAKEERVQRLIDSVREQISLGQQLAEISRAGASISPTIAFPTPAGESESPVESSRFTRADIDARYGSSTSIGSSVGSDVVVEVVVANTGIQPIRIVRVEGMIPSGIRVVSGKGFDGVENGALLMNQKRVEPMKAEVLQMTLRPRKSEPIIIEPRILFVDEEGTTQARSMPLRVLVHSQILEFLTGAFLSDYQVKRLAPDQSGWRTLSNIVGALKIPRSHIYGDPRWGHAYGRPIQALISSGLVETRTFLGERGRGGRVVKVRLAYEDKVARQYAETRMRESTKDTILIPT